MAQNNTIHIINCNVPQYNVAPPSPARVYVVADYVEADYVE